MTQRRSRLAWVPFAGGLLALIAGIWFVAAGEFRRSISLGLYLMVNAIVLGDLIDILIRLFVSRRSGQDQRSVILDIGHFTPNQVALQGKPYAIVASVHNAEETLDAFLEAMEPFRDRLFLIDDSSTDQTYLRLRRTGVPCFRTSENRKKPGAIRELLPALPRTIETVMVVDPDARILPDAGSNPRATLERTIFEFQRSGMAALCPRLVIREDGWLARLQELEYELSFTVGRRSLADHTVTSGIAIYRRDALESALERHSLSVYAEDLRNALLMLGRGERIYYDGRLVVETEGKRSLHGWFSQRVGWFYGLLKVYLENFDDVRRCAGRTPFLRYHYLIYLGFFSILFQPLKIIALALAVLGVANALDNLFAFNLIPDVAATDPLYFLLSYVKYTLLIGFVVAFTAGHRERSRLLATVPVYYFYCLLHIVPVTIGYLNWITLHLFGRRIYSDHFQDELSVQEERGKA